MSKPDDKTIILDGAHRRPSLMATTAMPRVIYQTGKDKPVMPLPGQTVVRSIG